MYALYRPKVLGYAPIWTNNKDCIFLDLLNNPESYLVKIKDLIGVNWTNSFNASINDSSEDEWWTKSKMVVLKHDVTNKMFVFWIDDYRYVSDNHQTVSVFLKWEPLYNIKLWNFNGTFRQTTLPELTFNIEKYNGAISIEEPINIRSLTNHENFNPTLYLSNHSWDLETWDSSRKIVWMNKVPNTEFNYFLKPTNKVVGVITSTAYYPHASDKYAPRENTDWVASDNVLVNAGMVPSSCYQTLARYSNFVPNNTPTTNHAIDYGSLTKEDIQQVYDPWQYFPNLVQKDIRVQPDSNTVCFGIAPHGTQTSFVDFRKMVGMNSTTFSVIKNDSYTNYNPNNYLYWVVNPLGNITVFDNNGNKLGFFIYGIEKTLTSHLVSTQFYRGYDWDDLNEAVLSQPYSYYESTNPDGGGGTTHQYTMRPLTDDDIWKIYRKTIPNGISFMLLNRKITMTLNNGYVYDEYDIGMKIKSGVWSKSISGIYETNNLKISDLSAFAFAVSSEAELVSNLKKGLVKKTIKLNPLLINKKNGLVWNPKIILAKEFKKYQVVNPYGVENFSPVQFYNVDNRFRSCSFDIWFTSLPTWNVSYTYFLLKNETISDPHLMSADNKGFVKSDAFSNYLYNNKERFANQISQADLGIAGSVLNGIGGIDKVPNGTGLEAVSLSGGIGVGIAKSVLARKQLTATQQDLERVDNTKRFDNLYFNNLIKASIYGDLMKTKVISYQPSETYTQSINQFLWLYGWMSDQRYGFDYERTIFNKRIGFDYLEANELTFNVALSRVIQSYFTRRLGEGIWLIHRNDIENFNNPVNLVSTNLRGWIG